MSGETPSGDHRLASLRSLQQAEKPAGHLVEGPSLAREIRRANAERRSMGIPELAVWDDEIESHPAHILCRRAHALGLARRRS